jgi:hypothetical protein
MGGSVNSHWLKFRPIKTKKFKKEPESYFSKKKCVKKEKDD